MPHQQEITKPRVAAIIPAAGSASRMLGIDKQFEELGGIPVLALSMLAMEQSDWIDELVVVARREDIPDVMSLARANGVKKLRSVVAGGSSRQQSVKNGLEAVSGGARYIAIHDGARPLVTQQVIAEAVIAAFGCGAAAAAVPITDTIKLVDDRGVIAATPDRSKLYAVQTPQVFDLECYRAAMANAQDCGMDYTDDCQMLEAQGHPVKLSPGDYRNIKITTPVDLLTARAIIEAGEKP